MSYFYHNFKNIPCHVMSEESLNLKVLFCSIWWWTYFKNFETWLGPEPGPIFTLPRHILPKFGGEYIGGGGGGFALRGRDVLWVLIIFCVSSGYLKIHGSAPTAMAFCYSILLSAWNILNTPGYLRQSSWVECLDYKNSDI